MIKFSLILPADFDEYEWEVSSKGYFPAATVVAGNITYRINFYDSARIGQEIASELEKSTMFFEKNLVIVPSVTRFAMEQAVSLLVSSGQIDNLTSSD